MNPAAIHAVVVGALPLQHRFRFTSAVLGHRYRTVGEWCMHAFRVDDDEGPITFKMHVCVPDLPEALAMRGTEAVFVLHDVASKAMWERSQVGWRPAFCAALTLGAG